MKSPLHINREIGRFGFVSSVLESFVFLKRIGFSVIRKEDTLVRFENAKVFINVYHGRSSYIIGVEIGRKIDNSSYNLYEVLATFSPHDLAYSRYQTTKSNELHRQLTWIAECIRQNCCSLLTGGDSSFASLYAMSTSIRKKATNQAQFGAILSKADCAWEAKDWNTALNLYAMAEQILDKIQKGRLKFLRKKVEGSN